MPHELAWAILLLPLFSFAVISLVIRPFLNRQSQISGYLTIATIGAALALAIWTLFTVRNATGHELDIGKISWLTIGDVHISMGLMVNSLTAVMLIVVTGVSLMVQIYSQGYMKGDPGYSRYFAFMSLFTASMLGLVLADNLLMLYVFWEMVGLCSYLLIGFWFHRPTAAAAGKKAFIVTRLGDLGFLIGILALYFNQHTFDIAQLHELAIAGTLGGTVLTWAALGIFMGAMGKSAQFPLHVWLPDAMEGPTPVSALIHAATMVAAGVFLVARLFPLFEHSSSAISVVAAIGGFTALFAATMGLVMNDIKRVVAYSTISQLGYMILALGVGSPVAAIFHLFNHAFFKALLFLGAGSANHATGTFDMREMGGLRRFMPWTYATFLIASLSLAGIPPLSGFWSKDEILALAWADNPVLYALALATVFMTAFYIFRVIFLTFGGEYRGKVAKESAHGGSHGLHESPWVMVIPMILLAIPAVISGLVNLPGSFLGMPAHWLSGFMGEAAEEFETGLASISVLVAALGIFMAYAVYGARWISAEALGKNLAPLYTLTSRKYFLDDLYERLIVERALLNGFFAILGWFDTNIVDGAVNGVAAITRVGGGRLRRLQTGQLQGYGLAMIFGLLLIIAAFLIKGG
ncbi:MAG: NADH-quinone oxidoreductase subunit L [Chloroflexi bacterium]|nr:NADH-quinone oxidoreductase subunit L [Chloroflexota bacterium]